MKIIDADSMVTVMLFDPEHFDPEHEEYYTERMTVEECLNFYTEEGCPSPVDRPQTDCFLCKWLGEVDVCGRCRNRNLFCEAGLQTDEEITALAKEIVHKMIDDNDIAEDAYPDLRQRMHEAVERCKRKGSNDD